MSRFRRWIRKICGKYRGDTVEFVEVKRDSRYIIVMEVPGDLSAAERTVLFEAVESLRKSLNQWIVGSDDKFTTVITIDSMPIKVLTIRESEGNSGSDD